MVSMNFLRAVRASMLAALLVAAALHGAAAQPVPQDRRGATISPINPGVTPLPGARQPMSGLDQQKLSSYRDQLESRMQQDRMSGRDMTPGGSRDMRNLGSELGRVNGALGGS
jgi:hypothetical protein